MNAAEMSRALLEAKEQKGLTFHQIASTVGAGEVYVASVFYGIMSAIDFTMDVAKQPDPKSDRVAITMSGKFLPYKRW